MFHAGKNGVGKHESYEDGIERSYWLEECPSRDVQDEWRAEHRSNEAVFNPRAVNISCRRRCEEAQPVGFLSYAQFKGVSWDKGMAGAARHASIDTPRLSGKKVAPSHVLFWGG